MSFSCFRGGSIRSCSSLLCSFFWRYCPFFLYYFIFFYKSLYTSSYQCFQCFHFYFGSLDFKILCQSPPCDFSLRTWSCWTFLYCHLYFGMELFLPLLYFTLSGSFSSSSIYLECAHSGIFTHSFYLFSSLVFEPLLTKSSSDDYIVRSIFFNDEYYYIYNSFRIYY